MFIAHHKVFDIRVKDIAHLFYNPCGEPSSWDIVALIVFCTLNYGCNIPTIDTFLRLLIYEVGRYASCL